MLNKNEKNLINSLENLLINYYGQDVLKEPVIKDLMTGLKNEKYDIKHACLTVSNQIKEELINNNSNINNNHFNKNSKLFNQSNFGTCELNFVVKLVRRLLYEDYSKCELGDFLFGAGLGAAGVIGWTIGTLFPIAGVALGAAALGSAVTSVINEANNKPENLDQQKNEMQNTIDKETKANKTLVTNARLELYIAMELSKKLNVSIYKIINSSLKEEYRGLKHYNLNDNIKFLENEISKVDLKDIETINNLKIIKKQGMITLSDILFKKREKNQKDTDDYKFECEILKCLNSLIF